MRSAVIRTCFDLILSQGFRTTEVSMAEIRVEPKRRKLTWVWVVLLIVVLAAIGYFVLNQDLVSVR